VHPGEECDDGNNTPGDGCENDCTVTPFCGNGIVEPPEECDDGNNTPGDGCENDCTLTPPPDCGDGNVDPGETCDPPGSSAGGNGNVCRGNCTVCGDLVLNNAGVEECDDGNGINGDGCENDCTLTPFCGDGNLDPGEACDDGNNIDGDGCESDCTVTPFCGDGSVNAPGEECESDVDCLPGATCGLPGEPDECLCSGCGDGIIDPGEECDPPLVPLSEICDNGIDDDGDGLVDCRDPDCPAFCEVGGNIDRNEPCMTHRDCRVKFGSAASCVSVGTCGSECLLENFCLRIDRDPARIRFGDLPERLDLFSGHGRFVVDAERDPTIGGFEMTLSNEHGIIFAARLLPGQMIAKGKGFAYKDKAAKTVGGLSLARLKYKIVKGEVNLNFKVKAYGNFSAATEPLMAIRIRVGTQAGFHEAEWELRKKGWMLNF
jgi:cysteine-rich repeat protein